MPTHERLGTDDREDLQGRRKPSIQLDKEPAIVVGKPGAPTHLTPQNDQLMSEGRVLCFKPALRLEWRGQDGQNEAEQCKHCALTLGDSFSRSNADGVFGTHTIAASLFVRQLREPLKSLVVHPTHAAHTTARHGWGVRVFLWHFGNHRFGCHQETRNRTRVL